MPPSHALFRKALRQLHDVHALTAEEGDGETDGVIEPVEADVRVRMVPRDAVVVTITAQRLVASRSEGRDAADAGVPHGVRGDREAVGGEREDVTLIGDRQRQTRGGLRGALGGIEEHVADESGRDVVEPAQHVGQPLEGARLLRLVDRTLDGADHTDLFGGQLSVVATSEGRGRKTVAATEEVVDVRRPVPRSVTVAPSAALRACRRRTRCDA